MDNIREVNLWNLTDGKTKAVVGFIHNLYPYVGSREQHLEFYKIKNKALLEISPDKMLEAVGYNFGNLPKIYGVLK